VGDKPKALIEVLSESLLDGFRSAPLLDAYDVYQHMMDYWAATMQDDVYLLAQEGWVAVLDGTPNTDLIPPALIVARYFAAEQEAVDRLEAAQEEVAREIEEYEEAAIASVVAARKVRRENSMGVLLREAIKTGAIDQRHAANLRPFAILED
jgi:hypothetical protein